MKLKFILLLIKFVLQFLEAAMEDYEKDKSKEGDVFPAMSDYGVCSYFYSEIKSIYENYQNQVDYENENC